MFSQPAPASAGSPTCRPSVPGSGSGPSSVRSLSPDALRLTNLHVDPDNRHRRPAFRRHHDVSDLDPGLSTLAHRSLGKQCVRQPERRHGRVWRWNGKRSWPYLAAKNSSGAWLPAGESRREDRTTFPRPATPVRKMARAKIVTPVHRVLLPGPDSAPRPRAPLRRRPRRRWGPRITRPPGNRCGSQDPSRPRPSR